MRRKYAAMVLLVCTLPVLLLCLNHAPTQNAAGRQLILTAGDAEVVITLNGSRAAAALVRMLPVEATLVRRNYFAQSMVLPAPLPDAEPVTRSYAVGDFVYWPDGQNVAVFYDDLFDQTSVPVIPLGKVNGDAAQLKEYTGTARLALRPKHSAAD